ncbi:MAG: hypothetical protein LBF83_02740, partial [Spirochaetaceae bacterium]|nr:hypothetical protein [Spirochaetaceae bacterium]
PRVWADSCRESGRTRIASLGGLVSRVWADSYRESGRDRVSILAVIEARVYGRLDNRYAVVSGVCAAARRLDNRSAVVSANSTLPVKPLARPKRVTRLLSRSANGKDNDSAIGVRLVQAGLPPSGAPVARLRRGTMGLTDQ